MRILYIEDDPAAQQYIFKGLGEHGFLVEVVSDGSNGIERATHGGYDLILLDVMLPDMEGFEVLRRLRQTGIATPVLFLSARSAVGSLDPTSPRIARAKAMSVAIGMAQPCGRPSGSARLMAT